MTPQEAADADVDPADAGSTRLNTPVAEGIPVERLRVNPETKPGPPGGSGHEPGPPGTDGDTPGMVKVPGIIPIDQDTVLEQQGVLHLQDGRYVKVMGDGRFFEVQLD